IALAAAVAEADVEEAVRTESETAPIVVRERLADEEHVGAARRGDVAVGGYAKARHVGVAGAVRVVDEDPRIARIAGMERDAEQPLRTAARHSSGKVEERPVDQDPVT